MGRPAKFSEDQVLDAALAVAAEVGPAATTVAAIGDRLGAPVGSIYHRFRSRDLLLARLWVRGIDRFQAGFVAALEEDDLEAAAQNAASHIPRWCRANLAEARVMLLHRREDLAAQWPDELGAELARLNAGAEAAITGYARRRYGRADGSEVQRVTFALVDVPYAGVRRYLLVGEPPPASMDELVAATCRCVLGGGAAASS